MSNNPQDSGTQATVKDERLGAEVESNIATLDTEFAISQEWGLFPTRLTVKHGENNGDEVLACLEEAQTAFKAANYDAANICLQRGNAALFRAQYSRPIWYISNNHYGLLPILFTAGSAILAYWLVFIQFLHLPVVATCHHAAFLGMAGAVLKSLYWLQYQINSGLLRPRWFSHFIVAPFIGVLLGGIASLVVNVGFYLASGSTKGVPDWHVVGLVAIFAGFNWRWALDKFQVITESIFSSLTDKKSDQQASKKGG